MAIVGTFFEQLDENFVLIDDAPFASGVTDHGALTGLVPDDDHTQYALLAGRAGGQALTGGTSAADDLTLEANTAVGTATGRIAMNSSVEFNSISATGAPYAFNYAATETYTTFIGGGLNMSGVINFTGSTFIYESFRGAPIITSNANPGFAAYTVLQALPNLQAGSGAGHNPLAPLILNCGPRCANAFSGTRTTATMAAVNWAPTVQTSVSGATMNVTNITGMTVAPKYSTVSGSTISFGTIRAIHCQQPAPALFAPGAGVEGMTAYIGLDLDNIVFGGNVVKAAVRSAQTASGTNSWFLLNNGNAHSDHGAGHIYWDDNAGPALGGVSNFSFDYWLTWNGAGSYLRHFFSQNGDSLRWTNPSNDRFLFDSDGGSTTGEYNWNCAKFSLGAQTGSVGNQVGVFVAGTRTVSLGGEWSDFLLTQAGNITVDAAMSLVAGWTINAPSITLGTGSVTTAAGLNIGGNPGSATNRVGLRILSNPSGGGGVNAALWITAGRSRFDGIVDINNGSALGGGAAATLGTIGGSGPTAAAQAQWIQIEVNGVNHWIPAWT